MEKIIAFSLAVLISLLTFQPSDKFATPKAYPVKGNKSVMKPHYEKGVHAIMGNKITL